MIDGKILPRNQWDPTAPSYSANVPLIAGSVETENGWVGPTLRALDAEMLERFTKQLAGNDAGQTEKLLGLYKRTHPDLRNQMLWLAAESDDTRRWTHKSSADRSKSSMRPLRFCTSSIGSRRSTIIGWARITRSTFRSLLTSTSARR